MARGGGWVEDRPKAAGGSGAAGSGEAMVPYVQANNIELYYEVTGAGEPLVLIPYLAADQLGSTTNMVIEGIFPWCFTPELYAAKPEYIDALADFVRGRPMPPVDAFLRQSDAVIAHDATSVLSQIQAPTQVTFGRHDAVTSTRFAGPLTEAIKDTELVVFEDCSHAPIYENVTDFNARTLDFLLRHS
jgi:pimeloyl-ACP methyl ester carboxylesterase